MHRRHHTPALVAIATASLVVTACSGGDDGLRSFGASTSKAPATSTAPPSTLPSTTPTSTTPTSTTPTSTTPTSNAATPDANGLTTAQPTPGDKFVGLTCAQMVFGFDTVAKRNKDSRLKSGPIPAITRKRESIGALLEGFTGKLEASGTRVRKDSTGKKVPFGYACYSGITDVNAYLSLEGLGFFYEQRDLTDNQSLLARTVKLRKSKYIAPFAIEFFFAGGLSNSEIEKNGNPGLGQTDLTKRAKLVPLKGSVFVQWSLNE